MPEIYFDREGILMKSIVQADVVRMIAFQEKGGSDK